jgi:diguanylate cyclase (GGDEF)-like protein/PAS domain S-box-containing protein
MPSAERMNSLARSLRLALPEGGTLTSADRRHRHRAIIYLLWLHALALAAFAVWLGNPLQHALLEAATIVPWALAASSSHLRFRVRSVTACIGLLIASAVLVHLANGAIEAHFHFFVIITVIALYQDWLPFLVAVGFVVVEHGLGGALVPTAIYNHADAWANPWKWAAIHGGFVLASCAALIVHWRLTEMHQAERIRAEREQQESQRALAMLMSNLPGMAYRRTNNPPWLNEFVSEGAFDLTGYTPEELAKMPYASIIHSDDCGQLWHDTQVAVAAHRGFQSEYRLLRKDGSVRWVLEQGRAVYASDGQVVALEGFITDISERRQAAEELAHQAQHDPLTDLPNRTLLRHELQEALRASQTTQHPLALLMMDLDRFKDVNDTFGHQYGDQLLQQVSHRLQKTLGAVGILARLGGDEFGVLLPSADASAAIITSQRLLEALEASFALDNHTVALGASVGIALFPDHADDTETLLRYADVAMYVAKRAGGGFELYSAEQDQHTASRLALAGELRQALEEGQLVLYYQPTIDCSTNQVKGVEALVRWLHPRRGLIPPDQFIPLAEQSGIINALTHFVLQAAIRQCRLWLDAGLQLTMSVNLSMRNLHEPHLPEALAEILAEEGVAADQLILEITESTIMADPNRALAVLQRLRALGVHMAIDDFGTGYSSMAYLKGLAVDALKIDKSFVQNLASDASDRAIVRSAVELGHNLGLQVVAEGVEDTDSYDQLVRLGCDLVQGYYMGRPMPIDDLERWLAHAPFGLTSQELAA